MTYTADLVNPGGPLASVTATLSSTDPFSFRTIAGQNVLNFQPVAAASQTTSKNNFTILVDRTVAFDWKNAQWVIACTAVPPVANAGPNQAVKLGTTVSLDGSGSTNPSGLGTLSYAWAFTQRPAGTTAVLNNATSVMPSFVADVPNANWVLSLTVSNGLPGVPSSTASVTVSTACSAPTANAGANSTVTIGSTVTLNGSASTLGSCGKTLTYNWVFISKPSNSTASISGANTVSPTFVADKYAPCVAGDGSDCYVALLTVNDGVLGSGSSTVRTSTSCVAPVANAGPNQSLPLGSPVQLNGAGSTDACGLPITYQWSLITLPSGSTATLANPTSVNPTFTPDILGTYVAQLTVSDSLGLKSSPVTVTVTPQMLSPTANAGANQNVTVGATVQLNCTGNEPNNPQQLPLAYQWSFSTKPNGTNSTLSATNIPNPTFVPDMAGSYVAQCIVTNSAGKASQPATVMISTACGAPPTANPGSAQNVPAGSTVTLDGSASGDSCNGSSLTYKWSLISQPVGSTATLTNPTSVKPTFVPDLAGPYVAQLIVSNGQNSAPATVTITATLRGSITVTPTSLTFGQSGPMQVTLSNPAPAGGLTVNVSSSAPGTVSISPATVTIAVGATSPSTAPTITAVGCGSATLTGAANLYSPGSATLNIAAPTIAFSGNTTINGTGNVTLTLSAPAPAGGLTIALTSSNPAVATVPASITIAAGATTATVTVTGAGGSGGTSVITATPAMSCMTPATITVVIQPDIVLPVGLLVPPNGQLQFPVSLSKPAAAGGVFVTLTISDPTKLTFNPSNASISLLIPEGQTTSSITPILNGLALGTVTITATAQNLKSASVPVTVGSQSVVLPSSVSTALGVQSASFNVTVTKAPASDLTVTLSSTSNATVSPTTVTIPAGATSSSTQVQVYGAGVGSATLTATAPGYGSATSAVTVTAPTMAFSGSPLTVVTNLTGTLVLNLSNGQAPTGGLTVNLSSSNAGVATVPATVTFAANSTSANVVVTGVAAGGPVTITASIPGSSSTATGQVNVITQSLLVGNVSVPLGKSATISVSAAPAPSSDLTVTLSSTSNASVSPATIVIPAGSTTSSTTVQVTGLAIGTATVSAAGTNYGTGTGTVTITAPTLSFTGSPLTVAAGSSNNLTLNLSNGQATGSGLVINLSSSNTGLATVPATVTVPANGTSVTVPVTGVAAGGPLTITATIPGTGSSATATVNVITQSIIVNNLSLQLGGTANLTVTAAPAPGSDLTVPLSSDNTAIVSVLPASITIPAGQTTASTQVTVTGNGIGSAHIIAAGSAGYGSGNGTVTVTAPTLAFTGPATVTGGNAVTLNLTLTNGQAPAGGLTVTLTSSNPAVNGGTATFAAGATNTSVNLTTTPVSSVQTATISAAATGITTATTTVTVNPIGGIQVAASGPIGTNQTGTITVTLPGSAPASPVTVNLTSSNTGVATIPASITIAAGSSSGTATVTGVAGGTANITASANGYSNGTGTVTVTPLALAASNVSISSTLTGTVNLTLTGGQAGPSGLTVNLSSADTSVATVPATASFAAGATTASFTVTAGAAAVQKQTTVTATTVGITPTLTATSTVTVTPQPTINITSPVSVNLGQSAPLAISVQSAPAADLAITLAVSDASKVSLSTTSVTIPAGQTTPAVAPTVTGLIAGASATVTASAPGAPAPGYAAGTATVNVTVPTMAITPSPITVNAGAQGTLTVTLAGGVAPASGLVINLASSSTAVATVPATVTIAGGANSATFLVNGVAGGSSTITATSGAIAAATATVTVPGTITVTQNPSVQLGGSSTITITLAPAAGPSGVTVNFVSSDPSKVPSPSALTIPSGSSTGTATINGAGLGSATLSLTATNYIAGSTTVTVTPPTMALSSTPSPLNLATVGTNTGTLTVTLSSPAPAGGLTVNFVSANTSVATVGASVTIPAGSSTGSVTVTAAGAGSTTITASSPGLASPAPYAVSVSQPQLSLSSPTINLGSAGTITVTLPSTAPAPSGGLTVSFSSGTPSVVAAPASITIPAGGLTGSAAISGLYPGASTITATAPGFTSNTGTVTVVSGLSLSPSSQTINQGFNGPLTVSLTAGQAPAGGVTVNLSSSNTGSVTVPASVVIPAGGTSVSFNASGVAVGSANITAAMPSTPYTAGAAVTVSNCSGCPTFSVQNLSVGNGLESLLRITLSQPSSGVNLIISVLDPSKALLSTSATSAGAAQVTVPVAATLQVAEVYVHGLVSSGTTTVQVSASGWAPGQGTITLTPSGFTVTGPGGVSSFSTFAGASPSTLTVTPVRLDAGGVVQSDSVLVRGGTSVSVTLSSTNPAAGSVLSPVTFSAGSGATTTTFTPTSSGAQTTTVSTVAPSGFTNPATNGSVTIQVQQAGILCNSGTPIVVGNKLETPVNCTLQGANPTGAVTVLLTSANSSLVQFSASPTGVGSGSLSVTTTFNNFLGQWNATTPTFYVYGLGNSGVVNYTAAASGYVTTSGTVSLAPAGFVIGGPGGPGAGITPIPGQTYTISVGLFYLDASGNPAQTQALAGGQSTATIPISNSNVNIGTVNPTSVSIAPGNSVATTTYTPVFTVLTNTTGILSIPAPVAGFTAPTTGTQMTVTYFSPVAPLQSNCDGTVIGKNLQQSCVLRAGTPASPITVTLTSGSADLLLSSSASAAGSNTITVTIPAGSNVGVTYYAQALNNTGTVTHTAAASGMSTLTVTNTEAPSAIIIAGPGGNFGPFNNFFTATVAGGPINLMLEAAVLDSTNHYNTVGQALRGGFNASVTLASSTPSVGTVASPITFSGGNAVAFAQFTPAAAGSVTVTLTEPAGFVTPVSFPANAYVNLQGTVN